MKDMENTWPLLELIRTRRSIRKYQDRMVEWDKIAEVLDSARYAPNAGNLQNYKFLVITDADLRKQLAEACMQQYWMEEAPIHIIFMGLAHHAVRFYGIRGDKLYSIQNTAACAVNMMLVAHSLGLATCWVGAFDEDKVKSIGGIFEYARPHLILTLGYPNEEVPIPTREPLYKNLFLNKYDARIKDIDAVMRDVSNVIWRTVGNAKDSAIKKSKKLGKEVHKKFFGKKPDFEKYTESHEFPKTRFEE